MYTIRPPQPEVKCFSVNVCVRFLNVMVAALALDVSVPGITGGVITYGHNLKL